MSKREPIAFEQFLVPAISAWDKNWFLLTAGDFQAGSFNCMTVAWGLIGVMWSLPCVMVMVRPSRFTYRFMEQSDSFTLCAFSSAYRDQLTLCGTHSGRELDKIKAAGLTPLASNRISAPGFDEADLVIECHKKYSNDLDPARFLSPDIGANYPAGDYHRLYYGQILSIAGTPQYRNPC